MNCAKSKELDQKSDKVIRFKSHHRQGFNSDYETLKFNLIVDIYCPSYVRKKLLFKFIDVMFVGEKTL